MPIKWNIIKSFNNSQNNAFEELVCQLAREEDVVGRKEFFRVAAPDGGVEAYCILENGDEYGWQAKYFSSMTISQWSQLKESFETAFRTHPNLKKYFICIPLDRQDPRHSEKMWFMDRWNEKVLEWTEYAKAHGREVSFEYWGSSELIHRLSQEKHAGRRLFWFSQEDFSDEWFKSQVKTSISNLGKRYTPEHNIELEIAQLFHSISKNDSFRQLTKEKFHSFLLKINKALSSLQRLPTEDETFHIIGAINNIKSIFAVSQKREIVQIDIASLESSIRIIENRLSNCKKYLDEIKNEDKDSHNFIRHTISEAWAALYEFSEFTQSPTLKLINNPVAFISGPAGIGKSHLLADIALTRIESHKSCILLLGQHFTSDETPWTQILRNLLRLNCDEKQFLGALNAKAESQGERLLFLIDAINEGRGRYFWPEHIAGFISEFSKYPWVGLILSIRSSYEKLFIVDDLVSNEKAIKLQHFGFDRIEYQASSFFFTQYNIEQPSIPLLRPEFSNPLFLKLFCEGLNRKGLNKIPKGYGGISSIIDFFIESIDNKLSKPAFFDYPPDRKIIMKVIEGLIEHKFENDFSYIPYEEAFDIADRVLSRFSNKRRFLDALISEGVLSKNLYWKKGGEFEEGIYLAYERFDDHLTASYLLDKYLDFDNLESTFQNGRGLSIYINDSHFKQGILESLSIQLPERTGKELYELLDEKQKDFTSIIESFINSLIWRKPETINEYTKEYVNKHVLPYNHTFDLFFQMVYSVASDPTHFYNANSLHRYLMQFSIADRDAIWTTYLHDQDHDGSSILRLINWAISNSNKSYLSDNSRMLSAKALAWLFTSTNIQLRDVATKALVVILENNLRLTADFLTEFIEINDPYVYERVFAATYGAVLRSDSLEGLDVLSHSIINTIFKNDEVYPNILVRDYARNIVEYASYKGCIGLENIEIIRPPYKSSFPSALPTNEQIDSYKYDYNSDGFKDYYWGQNSILSSMVTEYGRGTGGYGDFGRYTFQSAVHHWSNFDANDLSNYACKLIFEEYGYDVEKHGHFDRHANSGDRHKNKKERIGKKYQWIALYEVLARLADNYKMIDESTRYGEDKKYVWYQGPWEPFVRNIDPSVVYQQTNASKNQKLLNNRVDYLELIDTHENWLISDRNLPKPEEMISVTDSNNDEWLVLENHLSWEEPVPIGKDKYDYPRKHLWYQIRSYFVKEDETESLIDWLKDKHLMGRWFPECHDQYQVFSREYYWSPAYHFFDNPYYGRPNWESVYDRANHNKVIAHVLPTSERHIWESGADYENEPSYFAPREYMYSRMKLQYSKNIGEWLNENGQVVCFDPSVKQGGSSALVVKKDYFQKFLSDSNLQILWTCLGKKNIYDTSFGGKRFSKWLELSGVYTLNEGTLKGELRPIVKNTQ